MFPDHIAIVGGKILGENGQTEYHLLLKLPAEKLPTLFLKCSSDIWSFFMKQLGYYDENTQYCETCGTVLTERPAFNGSTGAGWTKACLCPAPVPYIEQQMTLPFEKRDHYPPTTVRGPQTAEEWKKRHEEEQAVKIPRS